MTSEEKERLGDEIAELAAHLDAATHRLLTLIRRFDESGAFADQGALTCAHWLCWRIGLELGAAREHVRVARALGALPRIDDALRHGRVSYSKVRALTRVATAGNEAALLEMARSSTASQLERICRGYRRALRAADEQSEDEADVRWFRERETDGGHVRVEMQLRPEEAAVLRRAIDVAMAELYRDRAATGTRVETVRRVDALVAMAERFLTAGGAVAEGAPPVEVVVHVEADALAGMADGGAAMDDGTALSQPTIERLACDARVVAVVEDSRGNVLDVGRRRRTIPTLLRRALRLRDRGCRFPGCTNRRVDGHHVVPWARGGTTALDNLCSLCRRHHTYVHEGGFHLEIDDNGVFRFFHPDGRKLIAPDAAAVLGTHPLDVLRERHRESGIVVDADTNFPRWDGTPVDYDAAVGALMPPSS